MKIKTIMAERKSQHFVPKWYQYHFSRVRGHMWIYKLATESSEINTINATCTGDWFYDDDGSFEKTLDLLETQTSRAVRKVIETPNIEILTEEDILHFHSFILLQFSRTRDASLLSKDFVDNFISHIIKPLIKKDEKYNDKFQEFMDSLKRDPSQFFRFTIQYALDNKKAISDLIPYLIVNKTSVPFLSSDSPVIKNNCYHLKRKPLTGFASPGLQIFCPLTDKLIFSLIHRDAYEIISNDKSIIEVTNLSDVSSFNKLQILNSRQELFLIEEKNLKYVRELHRIARKIKSDKKIYNEPPIRIPKSNGGYDELEPFYFDGINYGIQFSFLKVNKNYLKKFKKYWFKQLEKTPIVRPNRFEKI